MNFTRKLLAVVVAIVLSHAARAAVTIEPNENGATVKIDGQLFAEYLKKAGQQPALYPVIGPTGKPVTRSYPFAKPEADGTKDHPHHQSLWLTHGDVNGIDFWSTNRNDGKGANGPHVVHKDSMLGTLDGNPQIYTTDDWMNGDKRICRDYRTYTFGQMPDKSRWIDVGIKIEASDGDVTFGDTKEGAFSLRVADSMRVDAKKGGRILNSEKQADVDAWGQPARWVDYAGPIDGETVGITFMSHPESYRPTPRWHVRTYGLFAANPFGQKDFPNPKAAKQGAVTIKKGDSVRFNYRLWLHKGAANPGQIEDVFREFSRQ